MARCQRDPLALGTLLRLELDLYPQEYPYGRRRAASGYRRGAERAPLRAIRSVGFLKLGLALQKVFDANADLRLTCEDGSNFSFLEVTETQAVSLPR